MDKLKTNLEPSSPQSIGLIRDFLQNHHSGVLATADTASNPHGATVYFSVDEDFGVVFATKTKTQKYKNIAQNNKVALVCYDEESQTSVQISGHTEPITNPNLRQTAINHMANLSQTISNSPLPPAEKLFAGDYAVIKIVPSSIQMGIFKRPDAESNEELYERIDFTSN